MRQLKDQGYSFREEDMARLAQFVHSHLGVHGTYTFALPDLATGAIRDLREPTPPKTTRSDPSRAWPARRLSAETSGSPSRFSAQA
ncbi:hypothetical protein ACIBP6_07585 [Nonomuraea terrae]|uniref:hypothetical protein n=1 Tax=Nonomuraea terrae TaxID=2530383 RepID=UPI0037B3F872